MIRPTISHLPIAIVLFAMTVLAVSAQNQSDAPPALKGQATTQTETKVWTNDDIASVGPGDPRSTTSINTSSTSRPKVGNLRGRNVKWYRDQITPLQARIPPIDAQISELQEALDGKAGGDGKTSQRPRFVKIDQWPAELKDLQTKREAILDKIDVLRDEARHNGIPPNALP